MLSLSNAFNQEDLINFQKKNINFLTLNNNYEFETVNKIWVMR